MSKLVAMIDSDGLNSLINRLACLRGKLDKIARDREEFRIQKKNNTLKGEDDIDEGTLTRRMACSQLIAVLEFIEDSESLTPDLHKLLHALLDVERGRHVAWLEPNKRGRPPPSYMDVTMHARCAWIMNFLMERGGKSEQEAACFVIEHGGLRRWLKGEGRSQQNSAKDWRVVANWRDRIKGGSCTEEERIAYDAMSEIANLQLGAPKDVEREAMRLLRAIKIYFSRE